MTSKVNDTPLEKHEQAAFVQWLELNNLMFTATAQSTYTTSWNQKRLNHSMGVRKGFPDMVVIVPRDRSKDGEGYMLFIEMKRIQGGTLSTEQRDWIRSINDLNLGNINAYVAKGAEEAITIVSVYLSKPNNNVF